jgi:hypothetical protein
MLLGADIDACSVLVDDGEGTVIGFAFWFTLSPTLLHWKTSLEWYAERSGPGRSNSINLLNGIASPMGQPKTPGTILQNGYSDTNVKGVLAAGPYPYNILPIPRWFWQGLLSLDKPGDRDAELRCYKSVSPFSPYFHPPSNTRWILPLKTAPAVPGLLLYMGLLRVKNKRSYAFLAAVQTPEDKKDVQTFLAWFIITEKEYINFDGYFKTARLQSHRLNVWGLWFMISAIFARRWHIYE